MAISYKQFVPRSIEDRVFWSAVEQNPRHALFLKQMRERVIAAPPVPPMPTATDYLAAKRHNNRSILDQHWRATRAILSAMAIDRCVKGSASPEQDDRLLNWLWAFLTEASWTVSAHIPGNELPPLGKPMLDLASCEMAGMFAEMLEVLKPWLDSASTTLADSIIHEIDERILTPYANGIEVWWQGKDRSRLNNWLGVCAGSILTACLSLESMGHPRPKAKARAIEGLRIFFEDAFTPDGECDEGVSYWAYGVGIAALGLSRLNEQELKAAIHYDRFKQVADYPGKVHLSADYFFSGNDAGLMTPAPVYFLPWLASAANSDWLNAWAANGTPEKPSSLWLFCQILRLLSLESPTATSKEWDRSIKKFSSRFIPDQQVGIFELQTSKGRLAITLSGGHNAERHNHNDLGHFMLLLGNEIIIPDLGAPHYTADFFGPKRYSYVSASSRGHCCPIINGCEQMEGFEANAHVKEHETSLPRPRLRLNLSSAYPEAAMLDDWSRCLTMEEQESNRVPSFILEDEFRTKRIQVPIVHVIWAVPPMDKVHEKADSLAFKLGQVEIEISPRPKATRVSEVRAKELLLRDYSGTLHRLEFEFNTDDTGKLNIRTRFSVE